MLKENFGIIFDHNPKMAEIANDPDRYGSYYGTFHPEVPNFATFLGPMTGLGHNSIIFMIECQMQLLLNVLRQMWSSKATTAVAKSEAIETFMTEWRTRIG